tara:strand:+ start:360 stop:671 length:312 start_codon:yes stop_codon:yes gene_type:complete
MTTNIKTGRIKAESIGVSMMVESFFAAAKIFPRNQIDRYKKLIIDQFSLRAQHLQNHSQHFRQREVSNYAHGTGEDAPIKLLKGMHQMRPHSKVAFLWGVHNR